MSASNERELELEARIVALEMQQLSDKDALKELRAQMGLALGALGVALSQTLVELDVQSPALELLRRRAEAVRNHLQANMAHEAAEMLETFIRSLYSPQFFPGPPGND
jgi:uncharacterized coiled-coil protein SlyX